MRDSYKMALYTTKNLQGSVTCKIFINICDALYTTKNLQGSVTIESYLKRP